LAGGFFGNSILRAQVPFEKGKAVTHKVDESQRASEKRKTVTHKVDKKIQN
jgi:hypothetical protein